MHQVFIEVADEITTVVERLKAAPKKEVALVVPKGAVLLQSVVNLKLAKKAATDTHKTLTLVTTDKIGRNLATQLGIPTASSVEEIGGTSTESSEEPKVIAGVKIHRYYDPEPEVPAAESAAAPLIPKPLLQEAEPTPAEEEEEAELSPISVRSIATDEPTEKEPSEIPADILSSPSVEPPKSKPMPRKPRRKLAPLVFILGSLVVLSLAVISTFYFPKTHLVIYVPAEPWTKQLDSAATVNQPVQGTDRLTTAQIASVEPSETIDVKATGSKDVGNTATGTVSILNYQNSDPQTLPSGAKLTANGNTFVTTGDATVPGFRRQNGTDIPGSVQVGVTATNAGDVGNVNSPSVAIVSPDNTQLTARNLVTSGGTSKTVTVLTDTDIANAKVALTKQLDTDTRSQLDQQVQQGTGYGSADTDVFNLEDFSSDTQAGSQVDTAKATGKAIRKRLLLSQDDLKKSLTALGQADLKPGTSFTLGTVTISNLHADVDKGTATYTVQAQGSSTQTVNLNLIRKQITGKSISNSTDLIRSIIPNARVVVQQTPSWWPFKKIPYTSRYVTLEAKNE